MPAAYQIKDQTTQHYLTFQVVWCVGLFTSQAYYSAPVYAGYYGLINIIPITFGVKTVR
jgi:hypothetical protein